MFNRDIWLHILSFSEPLTILSFGKTSKKFYEYSSHPYIWNHLANRLLNLKLQDPYKNFKYYWWLTHPLYDNKATICNIMFEVFTTSEACVKNYKNCVIAWKNLDNQYGISLNIIASAPQRFDINIKGAAESMKLEYNTIKEHYPDIYYDFARGLSLETIYKKLESICDSIY